MSDGSRSLIEGSRLLPTSPESAREEPASSAWPDGPRLCDGSDFLGELICSATHPWYSIWKLSSRIAAPMATYMCVGSFALTFVSWFLFVIALSASADEDVGEPRDESAGWRAGVFFLAVAFVLLTSACVASLRGIFRARNGIAGSVARDCAASIPWVCGLPLYAPTVAPESAPSCSCPQQVGHAFQLAIMVESTNDAPNAATGAPRGHVSSANRIPGAWSTGLFECDRSLEGDLPKVNAACVLPPYAQLRNFLKAGIMSQQRASTLAFILVGLYAVPSIISIIAESAGGAGAALDWAVFVVALPSVFVSVWLRWTVRKRRGVVAACGLCEDLLTVWCCWGCALAQQDRELKAEATEAAREGVQPGQV